MATKKNNTPKKGNQKSTMVKISETIGTIAGEVAVKKDQIAEFASDAIDTVKATIQNITGKEKTAVKKAKKIVKKAATAIKKNPVVKKAIAPKKTVKKAAKKAVKKAVNKVVKKAAPKKIVKKAAKKK